MLTYTDQYGNVSNPGASTYSTTGVGLGGALGNPAGGTLTYPLVGLPIASGTSLTLQRIVPLTQPTNLVNQGGMWPTVVMQADDNQEYQIQQIAEVVSRAIVIAVSETGPVPALPPAVVRAGLTLMFDVNGNPTVGSAYPGAVMISAAMAGIVGAATAALALALLGAAQVATIAALRAATTATLPGVTCGVVSYSAACLPGGGMFVYQPADTTSADNAGTIIVDASGRRWYRQVYNQTLHAAWFGAYAGSPDNTAALNAAFAAMTASATLMFGRGIFSFASPIVFTLPAGQFSVTLVGDGADITVLYWPAGSGLSIACSSAQHSVHLRDLTFATGTVATAGTNGVLISNSIQGGYFAQSEIMRVTFRGIDNLGTYAWSVCLQITGLCNVNYDGCLFLGPLAGTTGTALGLSGVASGVFKYSIVHNISNSGFFNVGVGIYYGTWVQGVQMSLCNFTNGTTGVLLAPGMTAGQLAIADCQFNVLGIAISIIGQLSVLDVTGCDIYVAPSQTGISIVAICILVSITGNSISTPSGTASSNSGVYCNAATNCCLCTGNTFYGLAAGINLAAGSASWNVQSNTYGNCTNKTLNAGSFNVIGGGSP